MPNSARLWLALGIAQFTEGEIPADAQASFEQSLKLDPRSVQALAYLGTIYTDVAKYAEAVNIYERYNAAPAFIVNGQRNPAYAAYYSDPNRFFGTAPLVNESVRSDRYYTADMSLLKKTRISETVTFEVGAEFFNVFNQVLYLPADTFLGRQAANGTIERTNTNFGAEGFTPRLNEAGNRVIQLRARLIF
jgi:tetratricopeptide (TPR) repeat protein